MTDTTQALVEALERIERLASLVAHDLVGRVEGGKVAAVQQCSDVARAALAAYRAHPSPEAMVAAALERAAAAFDDEETFWLGHGDPRRMLSYRRAAAYARALIDRPAREALDEAVEAAEERGRAMGPAFVWSDTPPEQGRYLILSDNGPGLIPDIAWFEGEDWWIGGLRIGKVVAYAKIDMEGSSTASDGRAEGLREAAEIAYRTCAETRHVTLGQKCADATLARIKEAKNG